MGNTFAKDTTGQEIFLEHVENLYDFLRGERVEGCIINPRPALSPEEAFSVIYYLQEYLPVLPDRFEMCRQCNVLIDADAEGAYTEERGHYCDSCAT